MSGVVAVRRILEDYENEEGSDMPRRRRTGQATTVDPEPGSEMQEPRYFIDAKAFEAARRSFALIVRSRRCAYCTECENRPQEESHALRDASEYMGQIADYCCHKPDYLLPGTPLTEAVFRLLLANRNRPMTLNEIEAGLAAAWTSAIYLKNLSDRVLERLLDRPSEYCIRRVE